MSNESSNKICIIGIDGGSFNIINPLVDQGCLPNIGTLMKDGVHGSLLSTTPPITAPAWSSFLTGKNPGNHGIFNFLSVDSTCKYRLNDRTALKSKTLWRLLSEQGKQVISINTPMTYPPEEVNGILISGMLASGVDKIYYHPPEVGKCLNRYGYVIEPNELNTKLYGQPSVIFEATKRRAEVAKSLIKRYPWDVFMVTFVGSDRLQHRYWGNNKIVHSYYKQLDSYIGEIFALAGEQSIKIVISDHGFDKANFRFHINEILKRAGLLKFDISTKKKDSGRYFDLSGSRTVRGFLHKQKNQHPSSEFLKRLYTRIGIHRKFKNYIPISIRTFLKKILPCFLYRSLPEKRIYVNLSESMVYYPFIACYALMKGLKSQNLKDEEIRKRLMEVLSRISFKRQPIIKDIQAGTTFYSGKFVSIAPDFIVIPHEWPARPSCLPSNQLLTDIRKDNVGGHSQEGIFIAGGKEIKKQGQVQLTLEDLTPNILYLAHCKIPKDLNGKVRKNLYERFPKDPEYGAPSILPSNMQARKGYSSLNEDKVKKRLEDLGYL